MSKKMLYRVTFANQQEEIYEIYAQKVNESEMFGFIVLEDFVFGENTSLVIDPSEERLKAEFNQVRRTHIPMQAVYRIDEVNSKEGLAKIRDRIKEDGKVSMFPSHLTRKE